MKVYRIKTDVDHYQTFATVDDAVAHALRTGGTGIGTMWMPPLVHISEPGLKASDFLSFFSSTMILSPRATRSLEGLLHGCGEVLPLPYLGQVYTLVNVTNVIDCLDLRLSVTYPYVKKYVFDEERLSTSPSPLFKIPQTRKSEILLVEGLRDPEEELLFMVARDRLTGLRVDELWSDENSVRAH